MRNWVKMFMIVLYLPHRCSDFSFFLFFNDYSLQHSSRNINCICQAYRERAHTIKTNDIHAVCALCASIKWNAFSFSDWKSNCQWFLSQSAYINPIKLSAGKAVRRLYAWCTLNFDLMT